MRCRINGQWRFPIHQTAQCTPATPAPGSTYLQLGLRKRSAEPPAGFAEEREAAVRATISGTRQLCCRAHQRLQVRLARRRRLVRRARPRPAPLLLRPLGMLQPGGGHVLLRVEQRLELRLGVGGAELAAGFGEEREATLRCAVGWPRNLRRLRLEKLHLCLRLRQVKSPPVLPFRRRVCSNTEIEVAVFGLSGSWCWISCCLVNDLLQRTLAATFAKLAARRVSPQLARRVLAWRGHGLRASLRAPGFNITVGCRPKSKLGREQSGHRQRGQPVSARQTTKVGRTCDSDLRIAGTSFGRAGRERALSRRVCFLARFNFASSRSNMLCVRLSPCLSRWRWRTSQSSDRVSTVTPMLGRCSASITYPLHPQSALAHAIANVYDGLVTLSRCLSRWNNTVRPAYMRALYKAKARF